MNIKYFVLEQKYAGVPFVHRLAVMVTWHFKTSLNTLYILN